jgi:hypothetical protein
MGIKAESVPWREFERERSARLASSPIAAYEYVDATFTGAGSDLDIPHTLDPIDPESVRWLVVSNSAATSVYRDLSGAAKAWQSTHIWLRASAACTVRLLLFLEA